MRQVTDVAEGEARKPGAETLAPFVRKYYEEWLSE